jgi:predicted metal-dependent hydrolase
MRFALFRRAEADPAHLEVNHAGRAYRIALRRRPTARRMTLRISSATGEIVLTLPERTDLDAARRFADAHGGWIAGRLARIPARVAFAQGMLVPLRGVPHRIVHWSRVRGSTAALVDPDGEPIIAVSTDSPHIARRVRDFLTREAKRDLGIAVQRHTDTLGIPARTITVRDTRSRWGSCSAQGSLNFSWRLILAPPFVLDYLAAHEVAHLKEMNHSHRFWRIAHELCPRLEDAEGWLKRHGADLHRYG